MAEPVTKPAAEPAKPVASPAASAADAPKPLSLSDLEIRDAKIEGRFEELNRNLQNVVSALGQTRQAPPPATDPRANDPSDEQLIADLQAGNTGSLRRLISNVETRAAAKAREEAAAAVTPLQNFGLSSIAALTKRALKSEIPFYDLLANDIDKKLKELPAELQANPDAVMNVGYLVAGQNMERIIEAKVEQKLREARGNPDGTPGDGTGREHGDETAAKTTLHKQFEEIVGADAMLALKGKGRSPEDFVRTLGYKDKEGKTAIEQYIEVAQAEGA